ncbi:MAG: 2-amino-4-hydroxy-6-hydroxymethyldihydropteridine diphosphokinase [Alphaproteobacteria bacterium]
MVPTPGAIYVGIGANLAGPWGGPADGCRLALSYLDSGAVRVWRVSPLYESAPVPPDPTQPWYVNAVAEVRSALTPAALLARLHEIERAMGRQRRRRNEARPIDLDLLDYGGRVHSGEPRLPHPRLHQRAFVLLPLADLQPAWRHPQSGRRLPALIAALPPGQPLRRVRRTEPPGTAGRGQRCARPGGAETA